MLLFHSHVQNGTIRSISFHKISIYPAFHDCVIITSVLVVSKLQLPEDHSCAWCIDVYSFYRRSWWRSYHVAASVKGFPAWKEQEGLKDWIQEAMNRSQVRNISFKAIKSFFKSTEATPATELQKPLTSLPNATGAGAFVEPITYQVLGTGSNLLNIKLPRSSILNLRFSNAQQKLIAMNGHINSMYVELARLAESNLIFQRCFNQTEPMSLLIAQNAQNTNFAVIENSKSNWIVKKNSLFAWSGPSLRPTASHSSSNLIQMNGEGTFIVACPGQIMQIDLAENESIQVNTKTIVGYTANNNTIIDSITELDKGIKSVADLSVGKAPFSTKFAWIRNYIKLPPSVAHDPTVQNISKVFGSVGSFFQRIVSFAKVRMYTSKKDGLLVQLKGPRTIFLTNAVHIDDKILSDSEIRKLIS